MKEKDVIKMLLIKESEMSNRIHNAIIEIMRLGYESERGKKQISDMIESIRYISDDIEDILNI